MAAEEIPLADAAGRIIARQMLAASAMPVVDRAATDGLAVRASETLGASSYNPLSFRLVSPVELLPPLGAVQVNAGDRLPGGADAILPLDHVSLKGLELSSPVKRARHPVDDKVHPATHGLGDFRKFLVSGHLGTAGACGKYEPVCFWVKLDPAGSHQSL